MKSKSYEIQLASVASNSDFYNHIKQKSISKHKACWTMGQMSYKSRKVPSGSTHQQKTGIWGYDGTGSLRWMAGNKL